ncbi:MAG TPA: 4-hydroxy-tetrahydrodipicolinate reductase [Bryobacteraceae bacterium]|jgi:4-hydroxy-tetrahydrodipicolinate reductase|nr:4-hydroxy-tetrahydrodipicolinate reductase [Bryobacteraceae bacterium]
MPDYRLAISGYGKMGKLIEKLAPEYGFVIAHVADECESSGECDALDVAIDFSVPAAVPANVEKFAALGVNVVVGTTGWHDRFEDVRNIAESAGIGLIWSPNFSIGVNVFKRLVAEAARLLADESEYGAWAWEIHHATKKDSPSGTLLKLVQIMREAGYHRSIDACGSRAGSHPGTHEIGFDSAADTITLRHTARSREGFARGALHAAKWIIGKKGVHEFSEALK